MNPVLDTKLLCKKQVLACNATGGTDYFEIDRLGYDYVTAYLIFGLTTSGQAAAQWPGIKLIETDTAYTTELAAAYSAGTGVVLPFVGAATGVAGASFTGPTLSTTLMVVVPFYIDCRARKRYLYVAVAAPDANNDTLMVLAIGSRSVNSPCDSVTDQGFVTRVIG
jgi:hypothetical protein